MTTHTITSGNVTLRVEMTFTTRPEVGPVFRYALVLDNGAVAYRFRGRAHVLHYLRGIRENPACRVERVA